MEDSLCVNFAYHANNPSVGLALHKDRNQYKMFVGDTGLFITLAFWDKDVTENVIYQKLLSDKLSADLGYVYENVVAQELRAHGFELYYFNSKKQGELDFVIEYQGKVLPIEVKSGKDYQRHNALTGVMANVDYQIPEAIVFSHANVRHVGTITYLPIYMVAFLERNYDVNLTYKPDMTGLY